ncbi:MAG: hypothetical protein ACREIS_12475 [Nitrospiraceae bacterium]
MRSGRRKLLPIVLGGASIAVSTWLLGCASTQGSQPVDTAETVLTRPEAQVKTAVLQILSADGYAIQSDDGQGNDGGDKTVTTGYREETDSVWDWLLVRRFGVGRSWVTATLRQEGEGATRVTIQVTYEGKESLVSAWREYETPLQQSARNQLRLLRNALGLL